MGDEFSILSQWNRLLPAEKVGNSKESLVSQIEKEIPQKRKKKKRRGLKTGGDQGGENEAEEAPKDPEAQSGKIVDVTI